MHYVKAYAWGKINLLPPWSGYRACLSAVRIWANGDAVGVEHNRLGEEVSGSGRIANSHVNVPPIDGGDIAAVGAGPPGVPGEGATGGGQSGG